jgi:hypothetical protein
MQNARLLYEKLGLQYHPKTYALKIGEIKYQELLNYKANAVIGFKKEISRVKGFKMALAR